MMFCIFLWPFASIDAIFQEIGPNPRKDRRVWLFFAQIAPGPVKAKQGDIPDF